MSIDTVAKDHITLAEHRLRQVVKTFKEAVRWLHPGITTTELVIILVHTALACIIKL
jgi:hypothetical protein